MSVTLGQRCSLPELPLIAQTPCSPPPSPSTSAPCPPRAMTADDTTRISSACTQLNSGNHGSRVEHSAATCCHGNGGHEHNVEHRHHDNRDQECTVDSHFNRQDNRHLVDNHHGNRDQISTIDRRHTDRDSEYHSTDTSNQHRSCQAAGQPAEDRRPENASASRLRLQWASHAQPQLAMSDRPPSLEADREREWMGSQQSQEAGEEKRRVGQELSGEGQGEVAQHRKEQSARNGLSGGSDKLSPATDHHHPSHFSPEASVTRTPPPTAASRPRKQLLKTQSVGSISSESLSFSSLWEAPSYDTIPDFLSSLGFDDFDSPELIPDRFIPPELDFVRPSLMRQATLGSISVTNDSFLSEGPPSPPPYEFPLGATADAVAVQELVGPTASAQQQPPDADAELHIPPQTLAIYYPGNSQLPWQPASLETVVEETGSELQSPCPPSCLSSRLTPRLASPRLSIDTPTQELPAGVEGDVSAGLLGAGLAQRLRLHLLSREDLRQRQMSLGAESDTSSLYFSVASHFEEGERDGDTASSSAKREGGGASLPTATSVEESSEAGSARRRRCSNYAPPPQLLLWLDNAESAADTEAQPWPFSEEGAQAKESSQEHSPAHRTQSDPASLSLSNPASLSLNGNSNNNCRQRLKLAATPSLPVFSQRERLYMEAQMMSLCHGVQEHRLDEGGVHAKIRDINNCVSSAYQRAGHTPT